MNRLCYILPDISNDTHFSYNVKLIQRLQHQFNLFFIVEKGTAPNISDVRSYAQRYLFFPFRYAENFIILMWARLSGYKDFYVHYSFVSAINASIITALFGGRVYYWNAGLPWNYPQNFLRRFFEQAAYYAVDYVVTGTDGLARQYAKHYHIPFEKIKTAPNWIDVDEFASAVDRFRSQKDTIKKQLKIATDEKIVLFVHRLSHRKGAHYLPEIVNAFADANVVFIVAGDGPDRNQVESEFVRRNLNNRVRMLGRTLSADIPKYFAIADVFIMPSDEEGFPHVLLEAMAASVPFVAHDVGGVGELLSKDLRRYAIASGNTSAFIDMMRTMMHMSASDLQLLMRQEKACVQQYDIAGVLNITFPSLFI